MPTGSTTVKRPPLACVASSMAPASCSASEGSKPSSKGSCPLPRGKLPIRPQDSGAILPSSNSLRAMWRRARNWVQSARLELVDLQASLQCELRAPQLHFRGSRLISSKICHAAVGYHQDQVNSHSPASERSILISVKDAIDRSEKGVQEQLRVRSKDLQG